MASTSASSVSRNRLIQKYGMGTTSKQGGAHHALQAAVAKGHVGRGATRNRSNEKFIQKGGNTLTVSSAGSEIDRKLFAEVGGKPMKAEKKLRLDTAEVEVQDGLEVQVGEREGGCGHASPPTVISGTVLAQRARQLRLPKVMTSARGGSVVAADRDTANPEAAD